MNTKKIVEIIAKDENHVLVEHCIVFDCFA